jgi:hypothetical protein
MRIGIIGSRRRDGVEAFVAISEVFFKIYTPGDIIISGGCKKGGDRFAEILADIVRCEIIIHYPKPLSCELLKLDPKAAHTKVNYARNTLIAQDSDVLIASVAPDRKGGTEDTIKKWKKKLNTRFESDLKLV